MHWFMSLETTAQALNKALGKTLSVDLFKEFVDANRMVGNHFTTKMMEVNQKEDLYIPQSNDFHKNMLKPLASKFSINYTESLLLKAYYNYSVKEIKMNVCMNVQLTDELWKLAYPIG